MEEIWKDMVGYEDFYSVSNFGRVWSKRKDREISQSISNDGYFRFIASENGKSKCISTHRAVATAFLDNEHNFPEVNHKDENPKNNNVNNLEWCTRSYNNSYNNIAKRRSSTKKKVYQYNKKCELLNIYESSREASRSLKISNGMLAKCCREEIYKPCNGKRSLTLHGFVFSYRELDKTEVIKRFEDSENNSAARKNNILSKTVLQFSLDGEFLKEFESTQEVGRQFNASSSNISMCCRGELRQSHGYIWKYKEQ